MVQSILANRTSALLEQTAKFSERRHEILAGNVANVNTPHYRMRDLPVQDFQRALKQAVDNQAPLNLPQQSASPGAAAASQRTLAEHFPDWMFEAETAEAANITFQDAGNRSVEQQMMDLTKNSMMQNFVVELMRFQMNSLQAVIAEQP